MKSHSFTNRLTVRSSALDLEIWCFFGFWILVFGFYLPPLP